jgi:aspartate/glutamate racemase
MADETAIEVLKKGIKKVGLLGKKETKEPPFLQMV